jgi:hypothetical protein
VETRQTGEATLPVDTGAGGMLGLNAGLVTPATPFWIFEDVLAGALTDRLVRILACQNDGNIACGQGTTGIPKLSPEDARAAADLRGDRADRIDLFPGEYHRIGPFGRRGRK